MKIEFSNFYSDFVSMKTNDLYRKYSDPQYTHDGKRLQWKAPIVDFTISDFLERLVSENRLDELLTNKRPHSDGYHFRKTEDGFFIENYEKGTLFNQLRFRDQKNASFEWLKLQLYLLGIRPSDFDLVSVDREEIVKVGPLLK